MLQQEPASCSTQTQAAPQQQDALEQQQQQSRGGVPVMQAGRCSHPKSPQTSKSRTGNRGLASVLLGGGRGKVQAVWSSGHADWGQPNAPMC